MKMIPKSEQDAHWSGHAARLLVGRKIAKVRYMSEVEAEDLGWHTRPVVIELDDGTYLFPSQDDEGNGAGSIFGGNYADPSGEFTLPVLR
jgi:hypothetical protein